MKNSHSTLFGMFWVLVVSTGLLLAQQVTQPISNGKFVTDVNANGHSLTNAASVSTATLLLNGTNIAPGNYDTNGAAAAAQAYATNFASTNAVAATRVTGTVSNAANAATATSASSATQASHATNADIAPVSGLTGMDATVKTAVASAANTSGGVQSLSTPYYLGINFNDTYQNSCAGSMGISTDAVHWTAISGVENYCGDGAYPSVRDPSIVKINGTYWMCYTAAIGLTCSPYLAIAQSHDLRNWTLAADVTLTGISGSNGCISPKWFTDPATGNVYVIFYNFANTTGLQVYHTQLTNASTITYGTTPTFSTPAAFTTLGTGVTWVDACMIYANGVYNLFARDNTNTYYHKFTASSFAGTYTDASGAITALGTGEGMTVFNGPGGLYYAEKTPSGTSNWTAYTSPDLSTWTLLSTCTMPAASPGGLAANWDNGTGMQVYDANTIRDMSIGVSQSGVPPFANGTYQYQEPSFNMVGTQSSASSTVTVVDTSRLFAGMTVSGGTYVPSNDIVLSVPTGTTVVLNAATSGSLGAGVTLSFNQSTFGSTGSAVFQEKLPLYIGDTYYLNDCMLNGGTKVFSYVLGSGSITMMGNLTLTGGGGTHNFIRTNGAPTTVIGYFQNEQEGTGDFVTIAGGYNPTGASLPSTYCGWQLGWHNVGGVSGGTGTITNTVEICVYGSSKRLVLDGAGDETVPGYLATSATLTTVNGSTAGTATFTEPFQGTSFKKVVVAMSSTLSGTATYTLPTAFVNTPVVVNSDSAVTTDGTGTIVVTGGGTLPRTVILEGY